MSIPSDCCTPCSTVQFNSIPGGQGANGINGTDGADGLPSYTLTRALFNVPGDLVTPVTIPVVNALWVAVGMVVIVGQGPGAVLAVPGPAHFLVTAVTSTSITGTFLHYPGDTAFGTANISIGALVTASGRQRVLTGVAALTDLSLGVASNTIAATVGVSHYIQHLDLATGIVAGAQSVTTNLVLGYRFKLLAFDWVTTVVGAGAGASQVWNLDINGVNTTGGVITTTLASTNTVGLITAGTAITGANVGAAGALFSIEKAAGGTIFTGGEGYFVIRIQNMDSADAYASIATKVNSIITALT